MSIIKFQNDGSVHNCIMRKASSNIVELELNENVDATTATSGFVILNENNFSVQGDYTDYVTIYQSHEDNEKYYKLSNDGSVYVEPEPIPESESYVPIPEEIAEQERQNQIQELNSQISILKTHLNSSDYKIIKSYEYTLANKEIEYDIEALHEERQEIRNQINTLEEELNELYRIPEDAQVENNNNIIQNAE